MTDRHLAVGLWLLGLATAFIVTFAVAFTVSAADPLGTTLPRSGWIAALIGWGVGGGAVILAVGLALGEGWPARAWVGLAVLVGGIGSGVAIEQAVMQWAVARFGAQAADPDLIGSASVLSSMVVLVGLAALASAVLPSPGVVAARLLTIVLSASVLLSVASNVPGAANGVTPLGVPMGIAMAAGACVAVAGLALSAIPGGYRAWPADGMTPPSGGQAPER